MPLGPGVRRLLSETRACGGISVSKVWQDTPATLQGMKVPTGAKTLETLSGRIWKAQTSRRKALLGVAAAATAVAGGLTLRRVRHESGPGAGTQSALQFPDEFLWGTATAAYQIEGAVNEDGRGQSIWDTFSHTPGKTHGGDTGDVADDHYHRVDSDLDLMARLPVNAYRFSVAWPRVQPNGQGAVNQKGIDFYRRLVEGLNRRGIAPMITLYHWDLPQALQDGGGWSNRATAGRFADYADIVFRTLGDEVPLWITLNEPWVAAWVGYGSGVHAPGIADTQQALAATHHLLLAHGHATQAMRAARASGARLGVALNLSPVRPASNQPRDREAAARADGNLNRLFLEPIFRGRYPDDVVALYRSGGFELPAREGDLAVISAPIDFLGVNYYLPLTVRALPPHAPDQDPSRFGLRAENVAPTGVKTTSMGWPIQPEGLTELLDRLHHEYPEVPIHITENGAAFPDRVDAHGHIGDSQRIDYLRAHVAACHAAIQDGIDLKGYFVWSFLDNFEWAEGYSKRFGLVFVDYPTQRRTPKASYGWYRSLITGASLKRRSSGAVS
jgi:beta-glucosidase